MCCILFHFVQFQFKLFSLTQLLTVVQADETSLFFMLYMEVQVIKEDEEQRVQVTDNVGQKELHIKCE